MRYRATSAVTSIDAFGVVKSSHRPRPREASEISWSGLPAGCPFGGNLLKRSPAAPGGARPRGHLARRGVRPTRLVRIALSGARNRRATRAAADRHHRTPNVSGKYEAFELQPPEQLFVADGSTPAAGWISGPHT